MKYKLILIPVLILFSLSISGCWDSIELRNREIICAIGIDKGKEEGKVLLTFQSVIPQKLGTPMKSAISEGSNVCVISTTGNSVSDALISYRQQITKSIYLQQNRIIIIGEDEAKQGLTSILDFFLRYDESRSRALVFVCKGKASDILNWNSGNLSVPSNDIADLITSTNKVVPPPKIDMHELSLKLFSKTTSPIITRIEIKNEKSSHPSIKYSGAGMFDKDKLVGWLDVNETSALLWITNKTKRGFIEAFFPNNQKKTISQRITKLKTKINPKLDNGNITIALDVTEEGILVEKTGKEEINSTDVIKDIEKSLNKQIKKDIEACLTKVQKDYKTDVLGFGEAIHRRYPKRWKKIEMDWKQLFPDINVTINVNSKIRGTGLIIDSFK